MIAEQGGQNNRNGKMTAVFFRIVFFTSGCNYDGNIECVNVSESPQEELSPK